MRILTANLRSDGCDPGALAELLQELDPDLAALQELDPVAAEVVDDRFRYASLQPALDALGMGVASRYAIEVDVIDLDYRGARRALISPDDWPGISRTVEVLNIHFRSPTSLRALGIRRRQLRGFEAYLDRAPQRPRVVAGDLNASPVWPIYRRLSTRLRDAPAEMAGRGGGSAGRTWGPISGGPLLFRIDHVLVDGLRPIRTEVRRVRGSDHAAVVVDLEMD